MHRIDFEIWMTSAAIIMFGCIAFAQILESNCQSKLDVADCKWVLVPVVPEEK